MVFLGGTFFENYTWYSCGPFSLIETTGGFTGKEGQ